MASSKSLPVASHDVDPGFELGWDFAHYRLVPPAKHLLPGNPVRDGWEAGLWVFGLRTLRASPHVRKWLQLRLGAWMRGKSFEPVQVTLNFLERIDVPTCPIARRIGAGPHHLRTTLEAAWCEPLIVRRWQRVALRMDAVSCEAVAAALPAVTSGLAPMRCLSFAQATEGWALETHGMAPDATRLGWTAGADLSANLQAPGPGSPPLAHPHPATSEASLAI